jgi:hypothetical protein
MCQRPSKELLTITNDELGWNWRNVCLNCLPEVLAKGDALPVVWNVLIDTIEAKKI